MGGPVKVVFSCFLFLFCPQKRLAEAKRERVAPTGDKEGCGGAESDGEREDELPTVVVLKKGDCGEEEYRKYREIMKEKSKYHLGVSLEL